MAESQASSDIWSRWLLQRWHGGNEAYKRLLYQTLERVRSRVLDGAQLSQNMTLMDVGAGDGFVGFGAIEKIGSSLRVIFNDFSGPLLEHTRQLATLQRVENQCHFIPGSAERLEGVVDGSVDAVVTRACLAYVRDKNGALREFYRVLKAGGRLSIAEPVLQDNAFGICALGMLIDSQPQHPDRDLLHLLYRLRASQYPSNQQDIAANPITNYSERDLLQLAYGAGFSNIHLELHIDHKRPAITEWDLFLDSSPHPWSPTPRETLEASFSVQERATLERGLRPRIEAGEPVVHDAVAFLTAVKPN